MQNKIYVYCSTATIVVARNVHRATSATNRTVSETVKLGVKLCCSDMSYLNDCKLLLLVSPRPFVQYPVCVKIFVQN